MIQGVLDHKAKMEKTEADKEKAKATKSQSRPSYQAGTNYVPETGPATLHKGEMVIPKTQADVMRQTFGGVGSMGLAGRLAPVLSPTMMEPPRGFAPQVQSAPSLSSTVFSMPGKNVPTVPLLQDAPSLQETTSFLPLVSAPTIGMAPMISLDESLQPTTSPQLDPTPLSASFDRLIQDNQT